MKRRRWYLGIQSKKDPAHVMTEVSKAYIALAFEYLVPCEGREEDDLEDVSFVLALPSFSRSRSCFATPTGWNAHASRLRAKQ